MTHTIHTLFYTRITGKLKEESVPIYLRIYINGKRLEQSTNRLIDRKKWPASVGQRKGNSAKAKVLNNFFDAMKNKVRTFERESILGGIEINCQSFKGKLGWQKKQMIIEIVR